MGNERNGGADEPESSGVSPSPRLREASSTSRHPELLRRRVQGIMLQRFTQPCVVVSPELEILYFFGHTSDYLDQPSGEARLDLLSWAPPEIYAPLRRALREAATSGERIVLDELPVARRGPAVAMECTIEPLLLTGFEPMLIVCFRDVPFASTEADADRDAPPPDELARTRAELQRALEHLRMAGEEARAGHEELGSLAEGLSAIKQELQIVNEERKSLEHAIETVQAELEEERRYAALLAATVPTPLVVLDADLRVESANQPFSEAFHVTPEEIAGQRIYEVGDGRLDVSPMHELLERRLPEEKALNGYEIVTKDARDGKRKLRINAREVTRAGGRHLVLVGAPSVAERRRDAGPPDSERHRDDFLSMLGHELRNPLAAIAGGVELLGLPGTSERRAVELRALLQRQTKRLTSMVNDILDLSRVMAGKIVLERADVDLREVATSALQRLDPLLSSGGPTVIPSLPPPGEILVRGDAGRLTQVVENLLSNAIKFTPAEGRIWLTVEAVGETERSARVVVRDTGIGIEPELLPGVFEPFVQDPRGFERTRGGLGLGLPVVKGLVELHGGQARAFSAGPDRGTEVVVTLPRLDRDTASAPAASGRKPATFSPKRVLVIDDEEDIANPIRDFLRRRGHVAMAVHSGAAALEAVASFRPDLAFLDLALPDTDGYALAQQLRAKHPRGDLVLVALSGYGRDEAKLQAAGIDGHIIKPPDLERLVEWLTPPAVGARP